MGLLQTIKSPATHSWRGDSFLDSPLLVTLVSNESAAQQFFGYTRDARQVSESVFLSTILKQYIGVPIVSLLNFCCPTTIARFVVAAIVDAVDCVLCAWPFAHIRQKAVKTAKPSITNTNAFCLVVGECRTALVCASGNDVLPAGIGGSLVDGVSVSYADTPARSPVSDRVGRLDALLAALAPCKPLMVFAVVSLVGQYKQLSKLFAGVIAKRAPLCLHAAAGFPSARNHRMNSANSLAAAGAIKDEEHAFCLSLKSVVAAFCSKFAEGFSEISFWRDSHISYNSTRENGLYHK